MVQLTEVLGVAVHVDESGSFSARIGDLPLSARSLDELREKIRAEQRKLAVIAAREERKRKEPCVLALYDERTGTVDRAATYEGIAQLRGKKNDGGKTDHGFYHVVRFAGERDAFDARRYVPIRPDVTDDQLAALLAAREAAQAANAAHAKLRGELLLMPHTGLRNESLLGTWSCDVSSSVARDPDERSAIEESVRGRIAKATKRREAAARGGVVKCERCGISTKGYELHDYCATCSKNLCASCMAEGCCGQKPAASGTGTDYGDVGGYPVKEDS